MPPFFLACIHCGTIIHPYAKFYQGSAIGGPQYDDIAVLPTKFAQRFAKPTGSNASPSILINGHENVDINSLSYEVTRIMRSIRKLKPREKDDFALNKLSYRVKFIPVGLGASKLVQ